MESPEFMERLAALVPRRLHLIHFHGVFSAQCEGKIVPAPGSARPRDLKRGRSSAGRAGA
jgi:hypothetical protein